MLLPKVAPNGKCSVQFRYLQTDNLPRGQLTLIGLPNFMFQHPKFGTAIQLMSFFVTLYSIGTFVDQASFAIPSGDESLAGNTFFT